MADEFDYASIIADPNLVDPEYDISRIKTTTPTSERLLAAVPEYSGLRYDPTQQSVFSDLYNFYRGGGLDASQTDFVTPPADTTPVDTNVVGGGGGGGNLLDQLETDAGINTPFEQNLIDQGVGVQAEPGAPISAPGEGMLTQQAIDDLADYPVTPANLQDPTTMLPQIPEVVAQDPTTMIPQLGSETPSYIGGERTLADAGAGIDDVYGTDYQGEQIPMGPATSNPRAPGQDVVTNLDTVELGPVQPGAGRVSLPGGQTINQVDQVDQSMSPQLGDTGASMDYMSGALDAPYGVNPDTGVPYETPRSIADQKAVLGVVTEEDAANPKGLLEKIGLGNLDIKKTAVMAAINKAVGAPVSLLVSALEALPEYEPTFTEKTITDLYGVTGNGKIAGNPNENVFAGMNAYSAFGNKVESAKDRVNTIENTLANLDKNWGNVLSAEELEAKRTGLKNRRDTFKGQIEEVENKLGDIDPTATTGDAKGAEAAQDLDLVDVRDEMAGVETGDASVAEGIAEADRAAAEAAKQEQASKDLGQSLHGEGGGDVSYGGRDESANVEAASGDVYGGAAYGYNEAAEKGNQGGNDSPGKIVCTMMNESYGFGSFRNKIWLRHSKDLAPEYQIGYHKIFLPLVRLSRTNKLLKKTLEHIAVHRTIDIRQEARGKVHLLGRIYRKILEPICYWVGKYAKR